FGIWDKLDSGSPCNEAEMKSFYLAANRAGWDRPIDQHQDAGEFADFLHHVFEPAPVCKMERTVVYANGMTSRMEVDAYGADEFTAPVVSSNTTAQQALYQTLKSEGEEGGPVKSNSMRFMTAPSMLFQRFPRTLYPLKKAGGEVDFSAGLKLETVQKSVHNYTPKAVIIHHGDSPRAGHYTMYEYDEGKWFHCNDSVRTEVANIHTAGIRKNLVAILWQEQEV
ncbi:MAG: ubiquitin carboxyl-terminal hydrolase, partial [Chlamydiia bacterium]|nr:ubiquitin carboxyl-terminal hydrolase [Chlamydiia bacterium]